MPICGNVQRDEKTILIFFFSPYTAHIQHTEYFSLIGLIKNSLSRNIFFIVFKVEILYFKLRYYFFLEVIFKRSISENVRCLFKIRLWKHICQCLTFTEATKVQIVVCIATD